MTHYYLRNDVHLSLTGNAGILLDLRRGDYIGLNPSQAMALSRVVRGWPTPTHLYEEQDSQAVANLVNTLTTRGLLTDDEQAGKMATQIAIDSVRAQLVDRDSSDAAPIGVRHWITLALACVSASFSLKSKSLGRILESMRRRKLRLVRRSQHTDIVTARHLVNVFLQLRPYFYSVKDQCLFDSLVLTTFLAHHRSYPLFVIGVRTDPFSAHAWVQLDDCVLNGWPGYIQRFSPIVAV